MLEDETLLKGRVKIETTDEIKDFGVAVYFDYIDDETSAIEASITDNYVESNYSIQDHIAIKPKVYRLRGCVGEVVYKNEFEWMDKIYDKVYHPLLEKTIEKLKPITAISPIISNYTQLAVNLVKQVESSYKRYKKILDNFQGNNVYKNKRQETVVAILNQILQQRIPVNLSSLRYNYNPFEQGQYDKTYFLQSVSAHQGDNSFITDIEVTIKEFRIAKTKIVKLDKSKYGKITPSQVQKPVTQNEGTAKGQTFTQEQEKGFVSVLEENREKLKESVKNALDPNSATYKWCSNIYHKVTSTSEEAGKIIGGLLGGFTYYK